MYVFERYLNRGGDCIAAMSTLEICLKREMSVRNSPVQTSKFSLTSFICSCVREKIDNFSLTRSLV